jgi:6-phosphogluconolactonase
MLARDFQEQLDRDARSSRRSFLQRTAAFAVAAPVLARGAQARAASPGKPLLLYVGCYSLKGPEGEIARGKGIYLFEMNPATGGLTERQIFPNPSNPSWLALDSSQTHLYAVNETSTYQGADSGSVTAYAIERSTGQLTELNTVSSEGAAPCHLSVHPSGKYALVANYDGGTVTVLPIRKTGELAAATDVEHLPGPAGPQRATNAPPGSFAISGHDAPHAHMVLTDPAGRFVLSADLGSDRILIWNLDLDKGKLSPHDPHFAPLPQGDGPRHFAFHPRGPWLYSLQEESSTLVRFDYDTAKGKLTPRQTLSTLPKGFAGTNFPSEIRISPEGKFAYAANRLHDSIAIFSIGREGKLTYAGEEWTHGDYPRSITIAPGGDFLYSCNQNADSITIFRIHPQTGRLAFTGQYTAVGTPAVVTFLT